jgi:hypothetical protein
MKKIVTLDGREIHAEKMDDQSEAVTKDIAMKMAQYVNGQDLNITLNAVVIFIRVLLEMMKVDEKKARDMMDNMKMAVICGAYGVGEEGTIQ